VRRRTGRQCRGAYRGNSVEALARLAERPRQLWICSSMVPGTGPIPEILYIFLKNRFRTPRDGVRARAHPLVYGTARADRGERLSLGGARGVTAAAINRLVTP